MFLSTRTSKDPRRLLLPILGLALGSAGTAAAAALATGAEPVAPVCAVHSIKVAARERDYILCVPQNAANPAPLLLAFHGRAESAAEMQAASGLDAEAGAAGIITVYLDGCDAGECVGNDGGWQSAAVASPLTLPSAVDDDDDFVRAVIATVIANHDIDNRRVFAIATADGGTFAYHLACETSDLFAAVAVIDTSAAPASPDPAVDDSPCVRFTGCTFDREIPWCGVPGADHLLAPLVSLDSTILYRERLIETLLASVNDAEAPSAPAIAAPPPVPPVLEVTVVRPQAARPVQVRTRVRPRRQVSAAE